MAVARCLPTTQPSQPSLLKSFSSTPSLLYPVDMVPHYATSLSVSRLCTLFCCGVAPSGLPGHCWVAPKQGSLWTPPLHMPCNILLSGDFEALSPPLPSLSPSRTLFMWTYEQFGSSMGACDFLQHVWTGLGQRAAAAGHGGLREGLAWHRACNAWHIMAQDICNHL